MTDDEARKIAQHCIDAWPNGPKGYIWRDLVGNLDYGPAVGAFRALAKQATRTPTPGQFMEHYRHLARVDQPASGIRWRGDEISLDEYLARLAQRAANGNTDASDELDNWTRWLTPKGTRT